MNPKHPSSSEGDKVDQLRQALEKKRQKEKDREEPVQSEESREEMEHIAQALKAAEEESEQHHNKLLRVMAEFENYKKRTAKDLEERVRYGNEKLLGEMLTGLDDLDRVLDHVAEDASPDAKQIAEGVELARKNLTGTLAKFGLKEVEAVGQPFDPAMHEAISAVDSDEAEPGTVLAAHRKGYWLGERLLRPALVTVSKE